MPHRLIEADQQLNLLTRLFVWLSAGVIITALWVLVLRFPTLWVRPFTWHSAIEVSTPHLLAVGSLVLGLGHLLLFLPQSGRSETMVALILALSGSCYSLSPLAQAQFGKFGLWLTVISLLIFYVSYGWVAWRILKSLAFDKTQSLDQAS